MEKLGITIVCAATLLIFMSKLRLRKYTKPVVNKCKLCARCATGCIGRIGKHCANHLHN